MKKLLAFVVIAALAVGAAQAGQIVCHDYGQGTVVCDVR
jgi:hypothetical protein